LLSWALAKSSGKVLPTVIDTPLGRLDIPHREKLIANYFPKASNQVLIFATDAEISNEHYLSLKPYISKEYTINYDESSESSNFSNNYFDLEIA
jgi:DNA sulfur modification protein DndD